LTQHFKIVTFSQTGWSTGDIILIGTDGIHEARNGKDDMFGQDRLRKIIRENAGQSSASIKNAIIASLQNCRGNASQEDGITLVAIKLI